MIDVPVEVKDALREGTYKKNYRFVVGEAEWHEVGSFETIGWYTPSTNYGDDEKYTIRDSKTYRFIVDDADHDTYTLYIYKGTDPNWRTVAATSRNTWDITLINEAYAYIEIKSSSGNYYSQVSVQNFFAYTIDNNNLVSESVSIDERMCSGDTLKFGLCEGSSLEFQYFDFLNITGQRIQAFVDVESEEMEYSKIRELTRSLYSLPADGRYKITATAENMANIFALFFVHGTTTTRMEFTVAQDGHGEIEIPNAKRNDDIYLSYRSGTTPTAEVFQWVHKWHTIPMGFFDVKKCSRQASTGIIKVTAYNKLQSEYLDAKANDLVIEAVEEGEVGITGSATIDTILMKLLDGYTIEPKFIKATYTVPTNWTIVGGYTSYYTTPSDNQILVPYGSLYINISSINPNGAYRFFVDREKVQELLWEAMNEFTNANQYVRNPNYSSEEFQALYKWMYADEFPEGMHPVSRPYVSIRQNSGIVVARSYIAGGQDKFTSEYVIKKYTENEVNISFPMTFIPNNSGVVPTAKAAWENLPEATRTRIMKKWSDFFNDPQYFRIEVRDSNGLGSLEITEQTAQDLPDVTLRELQSAVYEVSTQFGQLSRTTDLFEGVELNHSRLYPADNLYPADTLYPDGAAASATKSMYSKLWADEGNIHKWRYLIITYKGLNSDNQEQDFTLQRTVNVEGTDDYNMSDNWLFRNLVWTASQVGDYADAMVAKMQDVTWFPFEMWCAGLPYLETGDEIEIPLGDQKYVSYVLQRQLKGIQSLQDTYINGTLDIY